MKWLILTALLVTGILTGCTEKEDKASTPVTPDPQQSMDRTNDSTTPEFKGTAIKSANEDIQLTLPKDWKEEKAINDAAIISASNESKDKYIMVIANQKKDFSDDTSLQDFVNIFKENTEINVNNMEIKSADDIKIAGASATLIEFTGEVQKTKVHYMAAIIEKGNRFYQIISWSSERKFSNNKDEFLQIIQSFQVLKEDDSVSLSPTTGVDQGKTSDFNSEDGLLTITLPASWIEHPNLVQDASIQASKTDTEDYVGVISEEKELFGDGTTLEDYHKLIADQMEGSLEGVKISDPLKTKVDERDALQFEISGEVGKVKIAYLITVVDHPTHYTQVILWTLEQYFKDKKPGYQDITNTLIFNKK
ncbi:PsbP-related protein [Paenibacillus sp. CMAA1364]